jgi:hypothetical protein
MSIKIEIELMDDSTRGRGIEETVNGRLDNGIVPPDVIDYIRGICRMGFWHPREKVFYPSHMIKKVSVREL